MCSSIQNDVGSGQMSLLCIAEAVRLKYIKFLSTEENVIRLASSSEIKYGCPK